MSYRRLKYVINYLITLPSALPWRVIDVLVVSRSNKFGPHSLSHYFASTDAISTAIATVAPTMGLLPIPRKPIISTCAGTEEEPAN